MKKRILYFLLIALAVVLIAIAVPWVASITGMDIGPGLTVASSMALLAVTWSYVRHTKSLVDVEKEILTNQHKQSHYAAVSQMWGLILEAEDTMGSIQLDLADPLDENLGLEQRLRAIDSLVGHSKEMRAHSSKIVRLLVEIDGELEIRCMQSAHEMLDIANDLIRYASVLRRETYSAAKENRPFALENLVGAWENPETDGDRSEARWSDYVTGKTIQAIDESLTSVRLACRNEIRARGAA